MEKFKTILEKRLNDVYYSRNNVEFPLNSWKEFGIEKLFEKSNKIEVEMEGLEEFNEKKQKNQFKPKTIFFDNKKFTRSHNEPMPVRVIEKERRNDRNENQGGQNYNRGQGYYQAPRNDRNQAQRQPATAPYNFVPINQQVIASNAVPNDFSAFSGNCGYIDIDLENVSPMFIRGKGSDFFKINNEITIPGSSFRGLVRNMVEIMSFSKMNFFEKNRKLFMRFIAAVDAKFKDNYYDRIGIGDDLAHTAKAGFLKFDKQQKAFFITPSTFRTFTILDRESPEFIIKKENNDYLVYTGSLKKYDKDKNIDFKKSKHTHYRFFAPQTKEKLKVSPIVIKDYDSDVSRTTSIFDKIQKQKFEVDIIKSAKDHSKYPDGIPIFYAEDEDTNTVTSIGHTKNYRLPYNNRLIKFVYDPHRSDIVDFAESIFGIIDDKNENRTRAGKVFFEDIVASETPKELPELTPKVLGSPRPTSFQLYLEQQPNGVQTQVKDLKYWDSEDTIIRGNKLYWHRFTTNIPTAPDDTSSWAVDKTHKDFLTKQKVYSPAIKALEKGAKFSGRIRFENLTDEELGALLMAICLPDNCCHKIGMAKPLGLGSIKITKVDLKIKDLTKRYSSIFNDKNTFETGIADEMADKQVYIDKFMTYLMTELRKLDDQLPSDFWKIERMKELKNMLLLDEKLQTKSEWLNNTKHQTIKAFKERYVLPKPSEV